jgi:hypothetical protein
VCRFPGGKTLYVVSSRKPTHTAIIRLSTEDSSIYNVSPPGNLPTQLSLGYLQKTVQHTTCVCRFPGGKTLYVEPSSVDNLMIAVWVGFLEDKRRFNIQRLSSRKPTHTAIIRLSTEDSSTYNACPPGNLPTQLSLGYLQKTVQHTTFVLQETYPHS